ELGGTNIIKALLGDKRFDYPKSLYAVEDMIRYFLTEKPDSTVLDFFGGSGTTTHAVMRLNRQDGGRRQSILVTNNEVSGDTAAELGERGLASGDPEWEARGIFEHVTVPRVVAAVTGRTPEGMEIEGEYSFTDEFPMAEGFEENVEFLELKYLDIEDVELDMAFESVAPLLWLRAGGAGPIIHRRRDSLGALVSFDLTDRYGVLFDPDHWRTFIEKAPASITTVFVVTDSPSAFASVAAELPPGTDVVRLYENYVSTFTISSGH
ncbi:MAG: site-specific DNA-methyltransferase, partial [Acidimicrobiaceae bacterium]|nr:site-specific DNA-methyltransferase [Acidimicrobiaceae bacterium]